MATKKELRKEYLEKRAALTDGEYNRINQALLKSFKGFGFNGVKCIHIYLPAYNRREPDTNLIIDWLRTAHPEIKIAYPKSNFLTCNITSYLHDDNLELEINQWGILEPIAGTVVEPTKIDMVIVPLLAVDQQGYRVGYGKGFYDRFLAGCKPGTAFVGLSHFEGADLIDDLDAFDIPLHYCLMEDGIIEFV